jgi:hypothetical protein
MKIFSIRHADPSGQQGMWEDVEADYFRVQDGALFLRIIKTGNQQYNEAVRVYARGHWAQIIEKKDTRKSLQRRIDGYQGYQQHARDLDINAYDVG